MSLLKPTARETARAVARIRARANPKRWGYFRVIGYEPRVGQSAYHVAADSARFLGFFSYPRGGKSFSAAAEVGSTYTRPDHHCWIVAPKYELGSKEFGYIYADHARLRTPDGRRSLLDVATRKVFNIQGGDMEISYPWGWFVRVKTADNPQDLLAEELDDLILAEAAQLPESVWDRYLLARVAKRKGRVHVPTTPAGRNWVYHRFYLPGRPEIEDKPNPAYDPLYWSATVSHLHGIGDIYQDGVYDPEEIERARREMAPDVFLEQFGGQFVSYSGLVWRNLHAKRHTCAPFDIPPDWLLCVAIDPGAGCPTAVLFGAWDNRSPRHLYLWHLIYEEQWPLRRVASAIKTALAGRRPHYVVRDPSAVQAGLDLAQEGLPCIVPYSRVFQDGYDTVTSLIETDRLHVFDTPAMRHFWNEHGGYQWKESRGQRMAGNTVGADHAMDDLRYMTLVALPGARIVEAPRADRLTQNERDMWDAWARRRDAMIRPGLGDTPRTGMDPFEDAETEAIWR